ncbi:restriction endonuclease subunit S [Micromonospora profundi]|uniref:restriction endonuclease subunit S n=1 Tax=Micromonospora profundi TaxID=1420889 RepID=UPI003675B3A8
MKPGDLLIAGLGDERNPVGRACIAPENLGPAIVKADCFRARLDERRVTHRFAAWALSSALLSDQVAAMSRGSTRTRINLDVVREIRIPVPNPEEQRRIADFLDAETGRIERLKQQRRRQIDLLESSEDSVLSEHLEATTAAPRRVKHLTTRITSGPRGWGDFAADTGSLFLRITNIPRRGITLDLSDPLYVAAPPGPERERSRTQIGDVLVSITADIGSVAVVDDRGADGNISQHVALVRPNKDACDATWLAYAIRSARSNQVLQMNSYGGTKVGLGLADVANLSVLAPNLQTQRRLALKISESVAARKRLRSQLEQQYASLTERRQALIMAMVTGHIDVSTASGRGIED